ncbi:MAG: hypothetical protein FD153_433 [Rhodospirillaceae bacterium]|nr:MAG: hypothetical protein FD153_433 [Rhodospirillaceae bacterium]
MPIPCFASRVEVDGSPVLVRVCRSTSVCRVSLRVDPGAGRLLLVLPPDVPVAEELSFIHSWLDWVRCRLAALPPRQPFVDKDTRSRLEKLLRLRQLVVLMALALAPTPVLAKEKQGQQGMGKAWSRFVLSTEQGTDQPIESSF